MPVVALATTEAPDAVPAAAGVLSTRVDRLAEGARALLADPDRRPGGGLAARAAAIERFGLSRFLADWDDLLAGGERMRIAMVSEHASPLAALGGTDAGGQNVHVAALAQAVARRGAEVVVHTRRDDPDLPERVQLAPGVDRPSRHGGAAATVPKDDAARAHGGLADELRGVEHPMPDVVHAHFWMSGRGAARRAAAVAVVQTFHALGGSSAATRATRTPRRRFIERDIVGAALMRSWPPAPTRSSSSCASAPPGAQLTVVPCGVDLEPLRVPTAPAIPRRAGLPAAAVRRAMVERKGIGKVDRGARRPARHRARRGRRTAYAPSR